MDKYPDFPKHVLSKNQRQLKNELHWQTGLANLPTPNQPAQLTREMNPISDFRKLTLSNSNTINEIELSHKNADEPKTRLINKEQTRLPVAKPCGTKLVWRKRNNGVRMLQDLRHTSGRAKSSFIFYEEAHAA